MYSTTKITRTISLISAFILAATIVRAVSPPPDGGYPNQNSAGGDDALFSLTHGADNALAGWIWEATGSLNRPRLDHTATLLQNGMVLVAAGHISSVVISASAELYNPVSGTWIATGSLKTGRYYHTATLLSNGMVLVAGGYTGPVSRQLASAELYDPASGTWTTTGRLNSTRSSHTATLLPNGMVLIAGGYHNVTVSANAELYNPASGTWTATGRLNTARVSHTATLLATCLVRVAG